MKRIDSLTPGAQVVLRFAVAGGSYEEPARFVRVTGDGDDRRATFEQGFEWDAYRYNGGWAYGTSAQRLSLVEVEGESS